MSLSPYNHRLLAAFNVTEDDLLKNRQGIVTDRQRALVRKDWRLMEYAGIAVACFFGLIFFAWAYETFFRLRERQYIALLAVSLMYLLPVFAAGLFSKAMRIRGERSAQEPLTATEGNASVLGPSPRKRFPTVYIGDGKDEDAQISIFSQQSSLFVEGIPYRVYRVGTEIVAIEALREPVPLPFEST